jgi:anti-sigma B factor antagonist
LNILDVNICVDLDPSDDASYAIETTTERAMEIAVDEVGDIRVVRIAGNLDTQTSPVTEEQLTQLIEDGATKILLDFEKLNYISSSGLRVLLVAHKRLEGNSGQVRICNPNTMVREVFDTSGFSEIFSVYGSQAEALDGF